MASSANGRQQEFVTKLQRIRGYLKSQNLGGVALSSQALFAWATAGGDNHVVAGSDFGVAHILVTPDRVALLTNNIEVGRFQAEEFKGLNTGDLEFWACPWHEDDVIPHEIQKRMAGGKWASDSGLPGSLALGEDFISLTYPLTDAEIARYKALGKDCSAAMEEALAKVRPGMTEFQIAGLIANRLEDHQCRPTVLLVAADERVLQFRHAIPTARKLKKHLMAVLCGKRGGLIVSLTRMMHFGRKLPDELRRKHDAVCAIDVAFNTATRPGRPMKDVFAAGLAEYRKQGFAEEWKLHHQGGPTGYQGRSFRGMPTETRTVLTNQAYAWNPSITGTKSEDTMIVHADGFEFVSGPSRKWPTVTVESNGKRYRRPDIKLI